MLRAAQEHLGITLYDVWFGYIAEGGDASLRKLRNGWPATWNRTTMLAI